MPSSNERVLDPADGMPAMTEFSTGTQSLKVLFRVFPNRSLSQGLSLEAGKRYRFGACARGRAFDFGLLVQDAAGKGYQCAL